jgi:putative transposase
VILYASAHEKEVPNGPLRRGVGLPKSTFTAPKSPGRPRFHCVRDIFDAIFYVLRSGCPWRLLPRNLERLGPPSTTISEDSASQRAVWHLILRALRAAERKRVGRDPEPSAAIVDSQSVKTVEESATIKGYETLIREGRRSQAAPAGRHLGSLPLSIYVTPANVRDQHGARLLLIGRKLLMPRLKKLWAGSVPTT